MRRLILIAVAVIALVVWPLATIAVDGPVPTPSDKPPSMKVETGSVLMHDLTPRMRTYFRNLYALKLYADKVTWLKALASDYHNWSDWALWRAVGICEQKGYGAYDTNGDGIAWHGSPIGGLPGSAYPGGLGLSRDFWDMFRGRAGVTVTNGALASPADQIRVARVGSQNGTHMRGWESWNNGCVQREMR